MTLAPPMRCSALAEELEEPMIGTVDPRSRWLLVEDHGAWGQDAVADVLGADRVAQLKAAGIRPMLIRRREGDRSEDTVRRAILADTANRQSVTWAVASLEQLEPDALASPEFFEVGAPTSEPLFLVCTNGKRDACCAVRGRVLLAALAAEEAGSTWECTHLGGHRFAANLVCLPDGIVYGRVPPADGLRLTAAYRAGGLDPSLLRGRSAWPAPAQVAEQRLRLAEGLHGLRDVELVSAEVSGDRASVTLATGDARHSYVMEAEPMAPPRPTSCRGDELEEPLHWRVVAES